jgi:hypothetical protein
MIDVAVDIGCGRKEEGKQFVIQPAIAVTTG